MAVRKQCNRYRTEPFGTDYRDVLRRGKAFHKDGAFAMIEYRGVWMATTLPGWGNLPEGARVYTKVGRKWIEK